MVRRLQPEDRRAEIIRLTRQMVASGAPREMTLRGIARYCGMSAPGLMHHFASVKDLIEEMLHQREDEDNAEIFAHVVRDHPHPTLLDLADASVRFFYVERGEETRHFDALESEAVSPDHPAHDYFARGPIGPRDLARRLAAQDYVDPEAALRLLMVLADGMRTQWIRAREPRDHWADWVAVRDLAFVGLERRVDRVW